VDNNKMAVNMEKELNNSNCEYPTTLEDVLELDED
jgi:hypothetical protein